MLRSIQGDVIINVCWSSCKVPVHSCQISMMLEFSRQIFEKYSNIKFHEVGGDCSMRTDAQTEIRDETNNRFSPFCERAPKLRKLKRYYEERIREGGGGFPTPLQKPYCNSTFPRCVMFSLTLPVYFSSDSTLFHIQGLYYI
jgi:hypothetical protein